MNLLLFITYLYIFCFLFFVLEYDIKSPTTHSIRLLRNFNWSTVYPFAGDTKFATIRYHQASRTSLQD